MRNKGKACLAPTLWLFLSCGSRPAEKKAEAALTYEGQLVRRPGGAPEDGKVYVVQNGKKHWILTPEWVAKHGYSWLNVKIISAQDLDSIPTAEPIQ